MPFSIPKDSRPPDASVASHSKSFSEERASSAFTSLGALPRPHRRSTPAFYFNSEASTSNSGGSGDDIASSNKQLLHVPSQAVPFPRASTSSPYPSESQPTSRHPITPGRSSSVIFLSNGKPLKSSLKVSTSPPAFSSAHVRARSAPATPSRRPDSDSELEEGTTTPKSVHFSSRHLTTVRTFKRTQKPAALLSLTASDTETESEAPERFPFPRSTTSTYALHYDPLPCPGPLRHVIVESLRLTNLTIQGTLLVKNMAYAKNVSVRFTLDDWRTISEVAARYTASLSSLPLATSSIFTGEVSTGPGWDRFTFIIKLEDFSSSLAARTLYFAARYAAAGGEWWDNNMGHNYRVQFQHTYASMPKFSLPDSTSHSPLVLGHRRDRISYSKALEKRLRGFKLANYAKPTTEATSANLFPLEQTTDEPGGSIDDELRRALELRAPTSDPVPLAFPMIQRDLPAPVSEPQPSSSSCPASSPISSTDNMYASFVEKWCFVGGVGA